MSELTKDMILDFFIKKGGVVKNVDLVRHFKKYLQVDDPHLKEVSRESFKEKVMDLASISMENGEKFLHLRPEYGQMAGNVVARPPSGRQSALLDNRLPAQQQERKPQEPPPPATANADAGSSRATRQSYAGPLTKPPAGTSLDEFTEQLDAYAAGRVEDMPTRPLSTIRAVQSVGSNLSSPAPFSTASRVSNNFVPSSLPTTANGSYLGLQDNSALTTATPVANAHIRQHSDSGSIGSGGSGTRPHLNGSPQHLRQSTAHGYSLLIPQGHSDGGGASALPPPPRGRSSTVTSAAALALQPIRRIKSPQDVKSRPVSARRSRHIDAHLPDQVGTKFQPTPPLAKKPGPAVAPKPSYDDRVTSESAPAEAEDDAPSDEDEADYGIDPIDKEWMISASRCDMDNIHRLIATDPTLLNRKDFIFGYTALHWAAKQGRCDVMGGLLMSGAKVDLQSNGGLTPLHLACQAGHDNAINILLDQNCNVNLREHGGKRAIDMLSVKVAEKIRTLVVQRTKHYSSSQAQTAPPNTLATFTRPRSNSALRRQWSSMEGLANTNTLHPKKTVMSPRMAKRGLSFRRSKKPKGDAAEK